MEFAQVCHFVVPNNNLILVHIYIIINPIWDLLNDQDDAHNSCCNHPEGYGYKKKDGYIPDLDTDDVEIFGVAHYGAHPAICWIQY